MKQKILIIVFAISFIFSLIGCKKYLDVNNDPNDPLSIPENLVLPAVEVTISTEIVGGQVGEYIAYWMQQLSLNQPSPNTETYYINSTDNAVQNEWNYYIYPNTLQNLYDMINKAETMKHYQYVAIGKTLMAYTLAITTDLWGDVPYTQALQSQVYLKPKYDSQESVYDNIQNLLDSAIYYAGLPPSAVAPSTDDYIYNGNMSKWTKFMYMLKARYYLRLSNAPGRTASVQADSALNAIKNAFASNSDNPTVSYPGSSGSENPWYENTLPGAGGVVLSKFAVDSLSAYNDPRLPIIADTSENGNYAGRPAGADPASDPNIYSSLNTFYGGYLPIEGITSGSAASLYLATYAEQLFIQAEATLIENGAAAATPIFQSAISAHMNMLGVSNNQINTYIASRGTLNSSTAIQQIIWEKYVADFLGVETYNDWRRTGYPQIPLAQNAYINYIPVRWPYSNQAILANPQPQDTTAISTKVWWNSK